jgi:hypothetical protein
MITKLIIVQEVSVECSALLPESNNGAKTQRKLEKRAREPHENLRTKIESCHVLDCIPAVVSNRRRSAHMNADPCPSLQIQKPHPENHGETTRHLPACSCHDGLQADTI